MGETGYEMSLKRSLWQIFSGTRGGKTRMRIFLEIKKRPCNINCLSKKLDLDYKTVQYHVRILRRSKIIEPETESRYGCLYFVSPSIENNMSIMNDIINGVMA